MRDKKDKPTPRVEVVRRPGVGPTPTPSGGTPVTPTPSPRPSPSTRPTAPRPGGSRFPPRAPRPPPTPEAIDALARREHVPARIAKGELEGKMKARIWRKLHAEEAKRFDEAYAAMAKTPGLSLADAFALVQSGMSVDELRARRTRTQKREQVKTARKSVSNATVEAFFSEKVAAKTELSFVLAERTVFDSIVSIAPVALQLSRSGRLEKLQVVLIAPRALWEKLGPTVERDPKLAQKPAPVSREPDRRPFSDPRAFEAGVGKKVKLVLRNGITLEAPFKALGAFDLLVELDGQDVVVPIHAIMRWEAV